MIEIACVPSKNFYYICCELWKNFLQRDDNYLRDDNYHTHTFAYTFTTCNCFIACGNWTLYFWKCLHCLVYITSTTKPNVRMSNVANNGERKIHSDITAEFPKSNAASAYCVRLKRKVIGCRKINRIRNNKEHLMKQQT